MAQRGQEQKGVLPIAGALVGLFDHGGHGRESVDDFAADIIAVICGFDLDFSQLWRNRIGRKSVSNSNVVNCRHALALRVVGQRRELYGQRRNGVRR